MLKKSTDAAKNQLAYIAKVIVTESTKEQWRFQEYNQTFDAQNEDADNWTCKAIIVYCHGSLKEDGVQAELAVIFHDTMF
jgi:hypothetical protein